MQSEKDKMLAGELYVAEGDAIEADIRRACAWMERYNAAGAMEPADRLVMLRELFGAVGDDVNIRPPFHCDYGTNIFVGAGVFMNFGCIVLDSVAVRIGALTQIGPGVQIIGADHPRDPALRRKRLEFGRPVTIGENVWIGACAIVLPGVTVADDAIIGAGAVVTRDVERGATVAGNPARPLPKRP